jgi:hypothetical protein
MYRYNRAAPHIHASPYYDVTLTRANRDRNGTATSKVRLRLAMVHHNILNFRTAGGWEEAVVCWLCEGARGGGGRHQQEYIFVPNFLVHIESFYETRRWSLLIFKGHSLLFILASYILSKYSTWYCI